MFSRNNILVALVCFFVSVFYLRDSGIVVNAGGGGRKASSSSAPMDQEFADSHAASVKLTSKVVDSDIGTKAVQGEGGPVLKVLFCTS